MALAVAALGVVLLVLGLPKRFARETLPQLVNLPGGSWTVGAVLGLITVAGTTGALRSASHTPPAGTSRAARAARTVGTAICCTAALGPLLYLLSGLPGRNCRSTTCAYLPGTGTAFLAYVVTAGAACWLLHRWNTARAEESAARERARVRRLRKRGRGRSRAAH
ncbi:hypothetical protein [Streptomyces sp. NPDC058735]|uniref:hypothetical protein n=1 Tax=unclassified Streptomyces TaxID=2593676 RepID=UPI0036ADC713